MIIYKTTNLINNKIYVGKHSKNNDGYLGSGIYLNRAIKKYGKDNFRRETLEVVNEDNWKEREIYWIAKLGSRNPVVGYNLHKGGTTGPVMKGKDNPNFGIRKFGKDNNFYGKKHTSETKEIIRNKRKKQKCPRTGKVHSDKTKKKISESRKGVMVGENHPRSRKVIVEGIVYCSITESSKMLLIKRETIQKRLKSKNFKDYNYSEVNK